LFALALIIGLAAAVSSAVTAAGLRILVVGVVGIWDAVAVLVRGLTVIRVVRERVSGVRLTVTVGVSAVRVGPARIFLGVSQTIAVRICVSVATRVRVEAVIDLPSVWQSVAVAVRAGHVRSLLLFLGVRQTVTVPVSSTIGAVKRVGSVCRYSYRRGHQYHKQCN
jgi:hypothetical protein